MGLFSVVSSVPKMTSRDGDRMSASVPAARQPADRQLGQPECQCLANTLAACPSEHAVRHCEARCPGQKHSHARD